MTAEVVVEACSEAEARALTDRIRQSSEVLWSLLIEAHTRRVWLSLGYSTWAEYCRSEFTMSRRYAYRLIDQARVIREVERAALSSSNADEVRPVGHITERQARDIKPRLAEVTEEIREQTREVPPDKVKAIVAEIIERQRVLAAEQREQRLTGTVRKLLDALTTIVGLPDPEVVAATIPVEQRARLDDVQPALTWLADFATALARQPVES